MKNQALIYNDNYKDYYYKKNFYLFEKLLKFLVLEKEKKKIKFSKNFIKLYGKNKNLESKLNIKKFLNNCKNNIKKTRKNK